MEITSELITILILSFVIGGLIVTAIAMTIEIKKHRPVKTATNADHYIDKGETEMRVKEDSFLRTRTTRVKVASNKK